LRRRPIRAASGLADVDSSGRSGPDPSHLVGFGILLSAALLIAIGSFGAPTRSGGASAAMEHSVAGVDAQGQRR
jgi:hypothetical protein